MSLIPQYLHPETHRTCRVKDHSFRGHYILGNYARRCIFIGSVENIMSVANLNISEHFIKLVEIGERHTNTAVILRAYHNWINFQSCVAQEVDQYEVDLARCAAFIFPRTLYTGNRPEIINAIPFHVCAYIVVYRDHFEVWVGYFFQLLIEIGRSRYLFLQLNTEIFIL